MSDALQNPDVLALVLAQVPTLKSLAQLQEVASLWRDTVQSQLDVLLSAVAARGPLKVGDLAKLLAIGGGDVTKLLKKTVPDRATWLVNTERLELSHVQTVFMHDWTAVQQVADHRATLKRQREEQQRAAAYERYGGASSSAADAAAPLREVAGRSMRGRRPVNYADAADVDHAPAAGGAAAAPLAGPAAPRAGPAAVDDPPGQLSGTKSIAVLAAIAAWKLRLKGRGERLLALGFRSERTAAFQVILSHLPSRRFSRLLQPSLAALTVSPPSLAAQEGCEVAHRESGRVYVVESVDVAGSRIVVREVPAERLYGGDDQNDGRFMGGKGVTYGPTALAPLRAAQSEHRIQCHPCTVHH